ncbi:MAG TPA: beta-ketoacyl-[acyl-carrier-protein] synthase family protein [Tepidisphaeraceae bacterium]|nr:beta-ketoacyl-[acyl-carrier-protein] synthase family protein [Tepidisphaeraceae bacterium]
MQKRSVVITGIGVVSPNGIGRDAFARACIDGRSGITWLKIDIEGLRSSVAAQALDFDPLKVLDVGEARRVPRMIPMALQASREAMQQAGVDFAPTDIDAQRKMGVALGTGGGGLAFVEEQYRTFFTEGTGSLYSITAGTHGNLSSELSIALHLRGPSHVLSTGCTSSTDAIGYARMLIQQGVVPMMLAGGADSPISKGILTAFEKLRVISTRKWDDPAKASRPFTPERDGFVLGEGAWMFVLEDAEHARARGAIALAEVAGYSSTCDAYHRVQIAPDVIEPVRAIELALADAGVSKEQVDYINLHGTSTQLNDKMETAAIHRCFGERAARIPGSSTKSMIGHPQGACGAAGLAATVLSMHAGWIHPTINLDRADADCDLDYVPNVARKQAVNVALCNCIAFGSKNSAIVVKRC